MLLRQVQARPLQGHHLRALRRRGDAPEGAPRADGSHRPRRAGLAHLVLQGRAEPHRLPARHRPARAREGALLRRLDRHRRSTTRRARRISPTSRTRCARESEQIYVDRDEHVLARRGAPRAPSRVLRDRQGEELRRGRRVLDPRPQQLGRGSAAADARGHPPARRRHLPEAREVADDRGRRRRSASSSARRRRARTASSPRARSSRSRPPPRRSTRLSTRSARSSRPRPDRRRARSRSTSTSSSTR